MRTEMRRAIIFLRFWRILSLMCVSFNDTSLCCLWVFKSNYYATIEQSNNINVKSYHKKNYIVPVKYRLNFRETDLTIFCISTCRKLHFYYSMSYCISLYWRVLRLIPRSSAVSFRFPPFAARELIMSFFS
jgi:hypothetical protein